MVLSSGSDSDSDFLELQRGSDSDSAEAASTPHCFPQSAGEAMCESHNYTETQCVDWTTTRGCCEFEDGRCWWNPSPSLQTDSAAGARRLLNELTQVISRTTITHALISPGQRTGV